MGQTTNLNLLAGFKPSTASSNISPYLYPCSFDLDELFDGFLLLSHPICMGFQRLDPRKSDLQLLEFQQMYTNPIGFPWEERYI